MKKYLFRLEWSVLIVITHCFWCSLTRADVTLPDIFSDNMVLQKAAQVPVWGWASVGESVTVNLDGQITNITTDVDGKWRVEFDLSGFSAGPFEMTVAGTNSITVTNVAVGEVWLASGQSNMEQMMFSQMVAENEILTVTNDMLRQFIAIKTTSLTPKDNVEGFWLTVKPGQTETMSALGYYFAKEIYNTTTIPVGIIKAAWGGKAIAPFISASSYDLDEERESARATSLSNTLANANAFFDWLDATGRADITTTNLTSFTTGPASTNDGWVYVADSGAINTNLRHMEQTGFGRM